MLSQLTEAEPTFFEKERERLTDEITAGFEELLSTSNTLNRKLEEVLGMTKEYETISSLWHLSAVSAGTSWHRTLGGRAYSTPRFARNRRARRWRIASKSLEANVNQSWICNSTKTCRLRKGYKE